MDWEAAIIEGMEARISKDNAQWKLGDLAAQVETSYGDKTLLKYAEAIGISFKTLQEYRRVAKTYEMSMRVDNLSWEHHRQLASHPERIRWLKEAKAGSLSVRGLRQKVDSVEITELIRKELDTWKRLLSRLYYGRAWEALGYESWEQYLAGELGLEGEEWDIWELLDLGQKPSGLAIQ